jgi:hypothetical protein
MISCCFPWYHVWYHKKPDFLRLSCAIIISFRLCYRINITIFWLWYQQLMILAMISLLIYPLISTTSYIIALWYQIFHVIVADIMVAARRDGAACGRHAPAAPPPPDSPSHAKRRCIETIGASSMDSEFKLEWYYSSSCGTALYGQPTVAPCRARPGEMLNGLNLLLCTGIGQS